MLGIDLLKAYGLKPKPGSWFFTLSDEPGWITVHPHGEGTKGQPVLLEKRTGEILGGLGGKFNGQHISALPEHGAHEEHGAQALITWYNKTQKGKAPTGGTTAKAPSAAVQNKKTSSPEKTSSKKQTTSVATKSANKEFDPAAKVWFGEKYRTTSELSPSELAQDQAIAHSVQKARKTYEVLVGKDSNGKPIYCHTSKGQFAGKKGVYDLYGVLLCVVPDDMCNQDILKMAETNDINKYLHFAKAFENAAIGSNHEYYPSAIGKFSRGKEMTEVEANGGKCNPNYVSGVQYHLNCQTCVVAYEARLRGFNLQAKNRKPKSSDNYPTLVESQTMMAYNPVIAWVDPKTGRAPETKELWKDQNNVGWFDIENRRNELSKKLDIVKGGERWNIILYRRKGGHIATLQRDKITNKIEIYDPQIGLHFVGVGQVSKYLQTQSATEFKCFRIDDKDFNLDVISNIFEKAKS